MVEAEPIGEYLRQLRQVSGMTLRDVENRTGLQVKNGYLSQVETGHIQRPSPAMLWHLAQVYGVSYEDLLIRAGHRDPDVGAKPDLLAGVPLSAVAELDEEDKAALRDYIQYLTTRKKRRDS